MEDTSGTEQEHGPRGARSPRPPAPVQRPPVGARPPVEATRARQRARPDRPRRRRDARHGHPDLLLQRRARASPRPSRRSDSPTPTPTAAAGANVGNVPTKSVAQDRTWTGTLTLNSVKLGHLARRQGRPAGGRVVRHRRRRTTTSTALLCWRLTNQTNFYVLQCGTSSPTGRGHRHRQYSFGPLENTPSNNVYPAGSIVEARTSDNAYSQGHQFFITYKDTTIPADSAGGYSIFGHVTSGLAELNSQITSKGIVPPASGSTTTTTTDGPRSSRRRSPR